MKYIPEAALQRWGACGVYHNILELFPGEPGVPVALSSVERIMDSDLYPNPARWAGHLMAKADRWRQFRAIMERELLAEYARAMVRTITPETTLADLVMARKREDYLRQCADAVLECREPRRMAQATIVRVYTYYAVYLGGEGLDRNPGKNGRDRTAVLWITSAIVRVMDAEPDTVAVDPGVRR